MGQRRILFLSACLTALGVTLSLFALSKDSSGGGIASADSQEGGEAIAAVWGDVDCTEGVSAVDALKILRSVAELPVAQATPCPSIGSAVVVSSPTPAATATPTPSPTSSPTATPTSSPTPGPEAICDAPVSGSPFRVQAGADFHATGGTDPQHSFKGADDFWQVSVQGGPSGLEPAFATSLMHTGDWAIYHFTTEEAALQVVSLCLRNSATPPAGTAVDVLVFAPPESPTQVVPAHDDDVAGQAGWVAVETVTITEPGDWAVFPLAIVDVPVASEYFVAVRLPNGESLDLPSGQDRNVDIGWVSTATLEVEEG